MWKHIGKNPEYVMVGETEDKNKERGKQSNREPIVSSTTMFRGSTIPYPKIV